MIPPLSLLPWSSTYTLLHFSDLVPYPPSFLTPAWRHHSYVPRLIPSHSASHPPARLISLTPLFGTGLQANLGYPHGRQEPSVFSTRQTSLPFRGRRLLTHPGHTCRCVLIRLGGQVEQRPPRESPRPTIQDNRFEALRFSRSRVRVVGADAREPTATSQNSTVEKPRRERLALTSSLAHGGKEGGD